MPSTKLIPLRIAINEIATGIIVGITATTSLRTPPTIDDVIVWSRTVAALIA